MRDLAAAECVRIVSEVVAGRDLARQHHRSL